MISLTLVSRLNYLAFACFTALSYYDKDALGLFNTFGMSMFQGPVGFLLTCIYIATAQLEEVAQKKIHQYSMAGWIFSLGATVYNHNARTDNDALIVYMVHGVHILAAIGSCYVTGPAQSAKVVKKKK